MMIYDYKTPDGRELKPLRKKIPKSEVRVRFLTGEERKSYGCDEIRVVKKRCSHCLEVKSDYAFLQDPLSEDGLSPWCRKCAAEERHRRERSADDLFSGI